ncbi:hypothetical protein BDV93DRAFT_523234 [Ceratobasidium sp. AG-I]|nr:hypothetical protein BDV93DRAFT_523234 [Ceratobasidium sp. AG-I]
MSDRELLAAVVSVDGTQSMLISKFQQHLLERIQIHVQSIRWYSHSSRLELYRELQKKLSQVWLLMRSDDSPVLEPGSEASTPGPPDPPGSPAPLASPSRLAPPGSSPPPDSPPDSPAPLSRRLSRGYSLNPGGLPDNEVRWLEELYTWSGRAKAHIEWVPKRAEGHWETQVTLNGEVVPGVLGVGTSKLEAKEDAAKQIEAAGVLDCK